MKTPKYATTPTPRRDRRAMLFDGSGEPYSPPKGRNRRDEANAPKFPRLAWADVDTADKRTPVAIYATRAEQRANRPDLKPIRVLISQYFPNTGDDPRAQRK